MTQDGPQAQTWTYFEEDRDAVNQARASKINDSGYSAYQRVFGKNPPQMEDAVLECGGADLGVVSRQQTGELAQERSMTMRRIALHASIALDHKRRWKRALHHAAKHYKGSLVLETWTERSKNTNQHFWHPGVVISNTLATVWIACRGSVVKCARSQLRPFTEDDEVAHEHITEHMRDLGERLLHKGDFCYEDITGQGEPPVDSPPAPEENTATEHQKPDGEGQMDVDPESRRRMRGKTRLTSLEEPSAPTANARSGTTKQETKEDHDDKRRRIDELESTVPTAAQDEVLVPCPETFDSVTRDDEIAVDVPLPEETVEMSCENSEGWITEEAFFTVSPGARQVRQRKEVKMNQLSPVERHEFLKSMEVEWQTCSRTKRLKYHLWKKRHKPTRAGRIVPWTPAGIAPGSPTTASHRGDVPRQDSLSKVLQTLTSLTSSHIL